ncbi:MAG: hypothetical protein K2I66_06270 [Bacteroidales bacterium]|nr:hypothetical protein [Bacteroidales bacterium]
MKRFILHANNPIPLYFYIHFHLCKSEGRDKEEKGYASPTEMPANPHEATIVYFPSQIY